MLRSFRGIRGVSPGEEMVSYSGKDLQKRKVLSLEWKSEGVMDDEEWWVDGTDAVIYQLCTRTMTNNCRKPECCNINAIWWNCSCTNNWSFNLKLFTQQSISCHCCHGNQWHSFGDNCSLNNALNFLRHSVYFILHYEFTKLHCINYIIAHSSIRHLL